MHHIFLCSWMCKNLRWGEWKNKFHSAFRMPHSGKFPFRIREWVHSCTPSCAAVGMQEAPLSIPNAACLKNPFCIITFPPTQDLSEVEAPRHCSAPRLHRPWLQRCHQPYPCEGAPNKESWPALTKQSRGRIATPETRLAAPRTGAPQLWSG